MWRQVIVRHSRLLKTNTTTFHFFYSLCVCPVNLMYEKTTREMAGVWFPPIHQILVCRQQLKETYYLLNQELAYMSTNVTLTIRVWCLDVLSMYSTCNTDVWTTCILMIPVFIHMCNPHMHNMCKSCTCKGYICMGNAHAPLVDLSSIIMHLSK